MSYGFATHLWILGRPGAATLKRWIQAAKPDAKEQDIVAYELDDRTRLSAVNTDDRQARWRSIEIVTSVSAQVDGFEWVKIDLHPDHDSWSIARSTGELLERDPEKNREPTAPEIERAKGIIRDLVPLELQEIHHYVDWAQELEERSDAAPVPNMPTIVRHQLSLGLPSTPRPIQKRISPAAWILMALCAVATAFTVSVVQPPGPAAFKARLLHFGIEGAIFWAMAFAGARNSSALISDLRLFATGLAAILAVGVIWSLVPV
jgi:hypothetical protein